MHHRDRSNYPPRRRSRSPHSRYSPPPHSRSGPYRQEERHGGYDRYSERPPYERPLYDSRDQIHGYDRWDNGRDSWQEEPRYDDHYRHEEVGLYRCTTKRGPHRNSQTCS